MEQPEHVQQRLDSLVDATWGLSTLLAAAEIGLLDRLKSGCSAEEADQATGIGEDLARTLLDVLVSLQLAERQDGRYTATADFAAFLEATRRDDLLAWLRSAQLQSRAMTDAAGHGELRRGWSHVDPVLLAAQGQSGRGATQAMASQLFPRLP